MNTHEEKIQHKYQCFHLIREKHMNIANHNEKEELTEDS